MDETQMTSRFAGCEKIRVRESNLLSGVVHIYGSSPRRELRSPPTLDGLSVGLRGLGIWFDRKHAKACNNKKTAKISYDFSWRSCRESRTKAFALSFDIFSVKCIVVLT